MLRLFLAWRDRVNDPSTYRIHQYPKTITKSLIQIEFQAFVNQIYQICISEENFGKINFSNSDVAFAEFIKFQLKHFRLQIIHEFIESFVMQVLIAFFAEEMHLKCRINFMSSL